MALRLRRPGPRADRARRSVGGQRADRIAASGPGGGAVPAGSRSRRGRPSRSTAALDAHPGELGTRTIVGEGERVARLEVPYLGDRLQGDALRRRLAVWVAHGVIEPSAAAALGRVIDHPEWLRLEGRRVVVLGAGAQTSPLEVLASWGAEVVAVDLPVAEVQERIVRTATAGAGTVHLPAVGTSTGANLIEDVPTLSGWLGGFGDRPTRARLLHLRRRPAPRAGHGRRPTCSRPGSPTAGAQVTTAFAGTPSDCYLVPIDVVEDSNARRRLRPRRAFELAVRGPAPAASTGPPTAIGWWRATTAPPWAWPTRWSDSRARTTPSPSGCNGGAPSTAGRRAAPARSTSPLPPGRRRSPRTASWPRATTARTSPASRCSRRTPCRR